MLLMTGNDRNQNSGCLFPFGGNFLPLFALLVLDDEERKRRARELEEEEEDSINDCSWE